MRKFFVLVKKEIQELLTPQMLVPLVVVVLVFVFIGKVIGKETEKSSVLQPVAVLDLDKSEFSNVVIDSLNKSGFSAKIFENETREQALAEAKSGNYKALVVIPEEFGKSVEDLLPKKVETYTMLKNFSILSAKDSAMLSGAMAAANENISSRLLAQSMSAADVAVAKRPVQANEFVLVKDRQANISSSAISGYVTSQTTFIPIILFLVIVFASQLIATSIASEKENKTLETLLSSPISRQAVVAAKLVAAGLVALLTSAVYLFGMRYYINGLAGSALQLAGADTAMKTAAEQLGLTLTTPDYALMGLSLFFGILAALAIAIILGSFAEDAKSAQGLIAPLMVLILVPYFLTMFLDLSAMSPAMKFFVYAIPFTHPFMAAPNIMLGQYQFVWYGIAYLLAFFLLFVYLASRIFGSDKIFTMKLKLKKKR